MNQERYKPGWVRRTMTVSCVTLLAAGALVLVNSTQVRGDEDENAKSRRERALESVGCSFEAARLQPYNARPAALERVAQQMSEVLDQGVPSERQAAAQCLYGEILHELGSYREAAEWYKKAEKSGREDDLGDDARFAYISSLEACGKDVEAAKKWVEWEEKYEESPLVPEVLLARTWNAIRRDTLPEAASLMDDLVTRYPFTASDPRVELASATLAYLEGQPEDALRILDSMTGSSVKQFSGTAGKLSVDVEAPAVYLRALCYQESGEMLQAAARYQEIVERHPESTLRDHAMLAKANIFFSSRAFRSAAEEFARVMDLASLPEVRAEAELRHAASVVLDGDTAGGSELLRETVAHHPGTDVGARAQYMLGEVLLGQSLHEEALLEFNRVLTDYFEHSLAASAQYRVGRCLDALGRQVEATSSYQAVVSGYPLSPESPAAAYLAGAGLLAQNLPTAAAPYFQIVLDRYAGENPEGLFVFASPEHQELVEASLCLLELSYHRAGNLGQLSGVPHLLLQKMPPSSSLWRAYALLIDADALASQGRYEEAQEELDRLISDFSDPRVGIPANRLLAWTYAQEDRHDLAMETETRMLSRYASSAVADDLSSAALNRAHSLFNQKKYTAAASAYEEFLQRYPDHPQRLSALYQAGLSYQRLDRNGNAVDRWEEIVARDSTAQLAEKALVRAGDLYFQTEHYDDAERCYQALLDKFSDTRIAATAMLRLAQCAYNAGNDRAALDRYSAIESRFPDTQVAEKAKKGIEQALYRLGRGEDGSAVLAELVERYPTSSFAADAQFEIAMRLYKSKRYNEAAEAFRRVVSQFPGYATADKAHYLMAESYDKADAPRDARLAYEQFLMFFPESELRTTVQFHLGSLRFVENDYMQAAVDFTSVLSDPEVSAEMSSASSYNLALCRRMLGANEEAQALLERYRQDHPSGDERQADVAYQLGDIHEQAGRTELAIAEYQKALASDPRPELATEIHYRIGSCREQLGKDTEAVSSYRKAITAGSKDNPFRLSALVRCAALYEKSGSFDRALSAYRDLIRNANDPEIVLAAKERVSQLEAVGKK